MSAAEPKPPAARFPYFLCGLLYDRPVPTFDAEGARAAPTYWRQKAHRRRKRLAGICERCPAPALPGRTYCAAHKAANVASAVAANRKNRPRRKLAREEAEVALDLERVLLPDLAATGE